MLSSKELLLDILKLPTQHPLKQSNIWANPTKSCKYLEAIPKGAIYLGAFHSMAFVGANHFGTIEDAQCIPMQRGPNVYYSMHPLRPGLKHARPGDVIVSREHGRRNYYYCDGPFFEVSCTELFLGSYTDQQLYEMPNWRFVIDEEKYEHIGNFLED